jgi:hypothetical protein
MLGTVSGPSMLAARRVTPKSRYSFSMSCRTCRSLAQLPHQVDQNMARTTRPLKSESATSLPWRSLKWKSLDSFGSERTTLASGAGTASSFTGPRGPSDVGIELRQETADTLQARDRLFPLTHPGVGGGQSEIQAVRSRRGVGEGGGHGASGIHERQGRGAGPGIGRLSLQQLADRPGGIALGEEDTPLGNGCRDFLRSQAPLGLPAFPRIAFGGQLLPVPGKRLTDLGRDALRHLGRKAILEIVPIENKIGFVILRRAAGDLLQHPVQPREIEVPLVLADDGVDQLS